MSSIVSLTMLAESIRIAVPYTCAAIAGVWAERSGVIQIGLEGILLTGAFSSVAVAYATGSASLGLVAAIGSGIAVSLGHGLLTEKARIHAVISGIAINLLALATTRMGLRALYDSSSNSPSIEGFRFGPTGATGHSMLARVLVDPVFICAVIALIATPYLMQNTRFGLRVRAAGENPVAASSVGIDITKTRLAALAVSGAICALGGAHLALRSAPVRVWHVGGARIHCACGGRRWRLASELGGTRVPCLRDARSAANCAPGSSSEEHGGGFGAGIAIFGDAFGARVCEKAQRRSRGAWETRDGVRAGLTWRQMSPTMQA
ncbi:MAG: ABC transporter permease [Polyangiaceae bacterium]|nr:ABC transporter permease [Polyangiaceae bacterium]